MPGATHVCFRFVFALVAAGLMLGPSGCGSAPAPTKEPPAVRTMTELVPSGPYAMADAFVGIQEAIDSLPPEGGTVVLSSRRYDLQRTLVLRDGITLFGRPEPEQAGAQRRAVLRLADGVDAPVLTNAAASAGSLAQWNRGIRLAGFAIDGNGAAQTQGHPGVLLKQVEDLLILDLHVRHCAGSGIQLVRVKQSTLRACRSSDNGRSGKWAASGIDLGDGSIGNVVEQNECNHNNPGTELTGAETSDGNGIRIGDYAEGNEIRQNVCSGNGRRGIKVQGFDNRIFDNTLRDNRGHALALHGPRVSGNRIERNQIASALPSVASGVFLEGAQTRNNVVRANHIQGTLYGIEASLGASANRYERNRIERTRGHGIFLRGSGDNTVERNIIRNAGNGVAANGIELINEASHLAHRNQIIGNRCFDDRLVKWQAFGLRVHLGVKGSTIRDNDFRLSRYAPGVSLPEAEN